MAILCLPGETLAGLISNGRLICPETCSRAQFPWYSAQPAVSQVAAAASIPPLPAAVHVGKRSRERKKEKQRHNRKQEQERDLADCLEARCRVWLLPPPTPHPHPTPLQDRVQLLLLVAARPFSSPGIFSEPLGLVRALTLLLGGSQ